MPAKPERESNESETKADTSVKVESNGQVKTELNKEELPDHQPDPKPRKRNKFCQCC